MTLSLPPSVPDRETWASGVAWEIARPCVVAIFDPGDIIHHGWRSEVGACLGYYRNDQNRRGAA